MWTSSDRGQKAIEASAKEQAGADLEYSVLRPVSCGMRKEMEYVLQSLSHLAIIMFLGKKIIISIFQKRNRYQEAK